MRMTTVSSGRITTQALTSGEPSCARMTCGQTNGRSRPSAKPPPRATALTTKLRRSMFGTWFMAASLSRARRSGVDRRAHLLVGAATADVGDVGVDVGVGRFRLVLEQRRHRHDHAALAIAALRHIVIEPGLLHLDEQVVRELKLIGFSDIRKVVSWRNQLVTRTEKGEDGAPVLMPRVTIVDADKISDEAAAAVAEVSQTVNGALRVKLHDKHAALVSIGKHLGSSTACRYKSASRSALSRCLLRSGNGSMSGKANELGVAAAGGSAAGAGGVVAPSLLARLLFAWPLAA